MRKLYKILGASAFVALLACPMLAASVPPKPKLVFAADTAKVTVLCPAAGPNTGCILSARDSVSGVVLFSSSPIAVGQSYQASLVCSAPGAQIVILASMAGTAPGVPASAATNGRGTGQCALAGAVSPPISITITFVKGGP